MDKDLPSKILDSNSVWAESQAVRKCPNQEIGGPLRRLIYQICSLEDVKSLEEGWTKGLETAGNILMM